jgi:Kef-type K+ transport system membrane component KefB
MEEHHIDLLNLLLVLLAAWFGGSVSNRLGYPSILGELIIGIILGPTLLGLLESTETIMVLSEVGIILLMVYIGIEIDYNDLKKASWPGLLAAAGGFIVPFALGYYAILYFGGTQIAAIFVAIAVGVTSLATKSRILVDLKILNTRIAYVLMAGALISDTLALIIFAGIVSFADAGQLEFTGLAMVAGKAALFFTVCTLIGLYILPLIGRLLIRSNVKSSTLYFTMILIVAFGFSQLAELAGMHSILGAFMAGLFIRDGLFPKDISRELNKTFYNVSIGFMAPIFFVTAGFQVSLGVFQTDLALLATVLVVAFAGKILGTALFYMPSGNGWREGITIGTGMNGRGAVEIIIAGIGLNMGIISQDIFSVLVIMAIVTTVTVPVLLKWTTNWLRKRGELVQVDKRSGYLILGVNPLSMLLAEKLQEQGDKIVFIDSNKAAAQRAKSAGFDCVVGNVLKEETLIEANAASLATFIGATSNPEINLLAAQMARDTFLIENNIVLVAPGERGAGVDILESINASTLFALKISLNKWIGYINKASLKTEISPPLENTMTPREWLKANDIDGDSSLPLFIITEDEKKRPFQFNDEIEKGEKVMWIIK